MKSLSKLSSFLLKPFSANIMAEYTTIPRRMEIITLVMLEGFNNHITSAITAEARTLFIMEENPRSNLKYLKEMTTVSIAKTA